MVRRTHARKLALTVITVVSATLLATTSSSTADHLDVTAVQGEAYASFASVSLFGGPPNVRGPFAQVTLPAGGSAVPITATAPNGDIVIGPATIFSSGPVNTSTQGTTGPNGSVTSTATLAPVNTSGDEIFTATSISSTCTASETGVTGSTTVMGGTIILQDPDPDVSGEMGEDIQTIPTNPAPNTTYEGTVANVNDNFRAVFNEQIVNPDGSLTVNAYHLYLLGPTAVGEVIVGHVVCGVTAVPSSTTTSTLPPTTTTLPPTTTTLPPTTTTLPPTTTTLPPTTTTLPPTTTTLPPTTTTLPPTTTTLPPTTTTLPPTTTTLPPTTTTLPPTTTTLPPTTTTLPPTTTTLPPTTTTLPPTTTTTTPPASGTCSQLQAQKAAFNAQITAIEASLAQTLSGAQLAAAIAQLEATRAAGNAQFDAAIAACNGTTTTTTSSTTTTVPPTTTTIAPPPPSNAEICAALLPYAGDPFIGPIIQQLLVQYGCLT